MYYFLFAVPEDNPMETIRLTGPGLITRTVAAHLCSAERGSGETLGSSGEIPQVTACKGRNIIDCVIVCDRDEDRDIYYV